jgi:hypothetical protein
MRFLFVLLLVSCGSSERAYDKTPTPQPDNWAAVAPIVTEYCKGCHAESAFVKTGAAFKGSAAPARLRNRSMPPANAPKRLSDEDRARLLAYTAEKSESKPTAKSGY